MTATPRAGRDLLWADPAPPRRPLPVVHGRHAPYWTGGARGELVLQRCATCRRILHPPVVLCPRDHSGDLRWEAVGGGGQVEAWTENRYSWMPGFPAPYLIALVAIDEDPSARLLTNLVGVDAADVWTGMPVRVVFEHHRRDDGDDVFLPLFTPVRPV